MTDEQKRRFEINVRGYVVNVVYTPDYFPGRAHFAFTSPHSPPRPHPVSETGYRSHFTTRAEVEKAGGAEAFAALYAEQIAKEKEPKPRKPRPKPAAKALERGNGPAEGGHAARIEEERKLTQREMF